MPNQTPTITATLQVTPDFTGRVLVYVKDGRATSDRRLFDDELVAGLDTFLELATRAGYQVISPDTGAAA
ncbi:MULTISPECIES: hypothetical protein [Pectobacterium]|uniref:Phage protein n=1 Tax=Pectobacterium versatile TaxID=2488639 RepID=A0AAW3RVM5_9GAMM|nr:MULTISPECIES: hypothetical protein [Pectobacterium]MBA0159684.1 hypothetical protein [Pectobacterium versatile]MBA0171229.1 hypothetical protein [Pectobacterium versatile]MBN3263160.1 hypothetical protein [Pectobacterium brasiliense]MCA6917012.1 hypothetical protein [Pectobacterium versatile]MCL6325006.1 hypothetical protein [Pectobacterium polaris]